MANEKTPPAAEKETVATCPPAPLLRLVKRPVVEKGKDGKATEKLVAIEADEVVGWREYEDRVVVVTADGQKFSGLKNQKD